MHGQYFCIPPRLWIFATTLDMLPFCVQVWLGALFSLTQASWHFGCLLIHWEGALLSLKEVILEYWPAFLRLSFPPGPYPTVLCQGMKGMLSERCSFIVAKVIFILILFLCATHSLPSKCLTKGKLSQNCSSKLCEWTGSGSSSCVVFFQDIIFDWVQEPQRLESIVFKSIAKTVYLTTVTVTCETELGSCQKPELLIKKILMSVA